MVLSAVLSRPYPMLVTDSVRFIPMELEEIRQGLREIKEGRVVSLSQLEEEFAIREGLS